jgi:NifB/MoaA-like Fe-S oxidoreductase
MIRSFENRFTALLRRLAGRKSIPKPDGTILTGEYFAPILRRRIEQLNQQFGARLGILAVKNNYFGGDVAVAGLLTGGDFLTVREQVRGNFVAIPHTALKTGEPVMLDGMKLEELEAQFGIPVRALDFDGLAQLFVVPQTAA